jgi:hypothetical protein
VLLDVLPCATVDDLANRRLGDAVLSRDVGLPFAAIHAEANLGNHIWSEDSGSTVLRLLLVGPPVAIFFGVWGVVVSPFNSVAPRRSLSHVFKERLKPPPSLVHCNSAPAVSRIGFVRWVFASPPHAVPNHVLVGSGHAVRGVVRPIDVLGAPAGFCVSSSERPQTKPFLDPTFAFGKHPSYRPRFESNFVAIGDSEFSVDLSGNRLPLVHWSLGKHPRTRAQGGVN